MTAKETYRKAHKAAVTQQEKENAWEQYLADKHKESGSLEIFAWVGEHAKEKYCVLRDQYYKGKIDLQTYLKGRKEAIYYYGDRLHELGVTQSKTPTAIQDKLLDKGLHYEKLDLPLNKIPMKEQVYSTGAVRVFLEGCDYIHQNLVPTLPNDVKLRRNDCKSYEVEAYTSEEYLPDAEGDNNT